MSLDAAFHLGSALIGAGFVTPINADADDADADDADADDDDAGRNEFGFRIQRPARGRAAGPAAEAAQDQRKQENGGRHRRDGLAPIHNDSIELRLSSRPSAERKTSRSKRRTHRHRQRSKEATIKQKKRKE